MEWIPLSRAPLRIQTAVTGKSLEFLPGQYCAKLFGSWNDETHESELWVVWYKQQSNQYFVTELKDPNLDLS